jgi:hypothetical protein
MVWSPDLIVDEDELDFTITGEVLRKGTTKLSKLRAPLDSCLRPDAPLDEALLLYQATSSRVLLIDGAMMVIGDRELGFVEERGNERG